MTNAGDFQKKQRNHIVKKCVGDSFGFIPT